MVYLQRQSNSKSHYDLSNGAIFSDLQQPLPPISRSRHYLMLNISETIRDIDIQGGSNENTSPDKMQFLDNRVRFLHPNFLVYMGEILLQF